jgi:hypothetical protein
VTSANYTISRKAPLKLHHAKISRSKVNIDVDMGAMSMRVLQLKVHLTIQYCACGFASGVVISNRCKLIFYKDGAYHLFTLGPSIIKTLNIDRSSVKK